MRYHAFSRTCTSYKLFVFVTRKGVVVELALRHAGPKASVFFTSSAPCRPKISSRITIFNVRGDGSVISSKITPT